MKTHFFKTLISFLAAIIVVAYLAPMAIEFKLSPMPMALFAWACIVVAFLVPFTALPIYLGLVNKYGFSYKTVVIAACISTIVVSIFFVFPFSAERSVVNGVVLAENGTVTLAGYYHGVIRLVAMGVVGVVAGTVFYFPASIGRKANKPL